MFKHTLQILQHLLEESLSDHFGTLRINGLNENFARNELQGSRVQNQVNALSHIWRISYLLCIDKEYSQGKRYSQIKLKHLRKGYSNDTDK